MNREEIVRIVNIACFALSDEIKAMQSSRASATHLYDGRYLGNSDGLHLYEFPTDFELHLPDECKIKLRLKSSTISGVVLACHKSSIVVGLNELAGEEISSADLLSEPWYLLDAQRDFLLKACEEGSSRNLTLASRLLGIERPDIVSDRTHLSTFLNGHLASRPRWNSHQVDAAAKSIGSKVAFIWGPPGTGKTSTLALAVAGLITKGERVLVTSHSNAAVDAAMAAIARCLAGSPLIQAGRIVRSGYCSRRQELSALGVHPEAILARSHPNVVSTITTLEKEVERLVRALKAKEEPSQSKRAELTSALSRTRELLAEQRRVYDDLVRRLTASAQVVGATLARTFISDLSQQSFDSVLIDEASMIIVPSCLAAAALAKERISVFGDFRQLPPIVLADSDKAKEWLHTDIYHKAGLIGERGRVLDQDDRMSLLALQYRMHPAISRIANDHFYGDRLQDSPEVQARTPIQVLPDLLGSSPVLFLDTAGIGAIAAKQPDHDSHYNAISSTLSAVIATLAAQSGVETAVITPYAFQARMTLATLQDLSDAGGKHPPCATVHRFQGSEAPSVLIDLTDARGLKNLGILLRGDSNSAGARLINVAITRAQHKLILLGDYSWIRETAQYDSSLGLILRQVFGPESSRVKVSDILTKLSLPKTKASFISDANSSGEIDREIIKPSAGVTVQISNLSDSPYLSTVRRLVNGSRPLSIYALPLERDRLAESLPGANIIGSTPSPIDFIDLDGATVWLRLHGTGTSGFLRVQSKRLSSLLRKVIEATQRTLEKSTSAIPAASSAELEKNPLGEKCPRCSKALWIQAGPNGPYLKCMALGCSGTRSLSEASLTRFAQVSQARCNQCGTFYIGRRGPYGWFFGCPNYPSCKGKDRLDQYL